MYKNILYTILGLSLVIGSFLLYKNASCDIRWRGTGYETEYFFGSGCLVKQSNGKLLPEDKVRPE